MRGKKNGDIRLCTDLRYVNSGTIPDAFPAQNIEELVMKISGSNWISTLDNSAGYWQIPIEPGHEYRTAFVTNRGLFEWVVMPFGLRTASGSYQRVMNDLLAPHKAYSDAYIDDTAVFSMSWINHLLHLENVLKEFRNVNMTLRLSKCKFAKQKVDYVGHEIGSGGRSPLKNKVEAIKQIAEPTTKSCSNHSSVE